MVGRREKAGRPAAAQKFREKKFYSLFPVNFRRAEPSSNFEQLRTTSLFFVFDIKPLSLHKKLKSEAPNTNKASSTKLTADIPDIEAQRPIHATPKP